VFGSGWGGFLENLGCLVISPRNVLGSSSILLLFASNSEEAMRRKREGAVDLMRLKRVAN
jgi:hypothetical protein